MSQEEQQQNPLSEPEEEPKRRGIPVGLWVIIIFFAVVFGSLIWSLIRQAQALP